MINIMFGSNFLLGGIVLLGMILFYLLRFIRPAVARDEDIFFTSVGLLYGCIIIIHGWRLDPILIFSQVLLVGTLLSCGWENVRLRGFIVYQSKQK
jgi:hypothetical protein